MNQTISSDMIRQRAESHGLAQAGRELEAEAAQKQALEDLELRQRGAMQAQGNQVAVERMAPLRPLYVKRDQAALAVAEAVRKFESAEDEIRGAFQPIIADWAASQAGVPSIVRIDFNTLRAQAGLAPHSHIGVPVSGKAAVVLFGLTTGMIGENGIQVGSQGVVIG
jgi:hypothetical protein